jgi:hypothetical protein
MKLFGKSRVFIATILVFSTVSSLFIIDFIVAANHSSAYKPKCPI